MAPNSILKKSLDASSPRSTRSKQNADYKDVPKKAQESLQMMAEENQRKFKHPIKIPQKWIINPLNFAVFLAKGRTEDLGCEIPTQKQIEDYVNEMRTVKTVRISTGPPKIELRRSDTEDDNSSTERLSSKRVKLKKISTRKATPGKIGKKAVPGRKEEKAPTTRIVSKKRTVRRAI